MMRVSAAIVLGLLSGMVARAGDAQTPTALTIRGRVVADDSGDPIRNARVGTAEGPNALAALTDPEGRFSLTPVPADQHDLFVARTGYVRTIVPAATDTEIRLVKGAAITGHVLDDLGDPMPLMNVAAFRVRRAGGRATFERFRATETDDLGEYRLFGLPAGEFIVAAAPGRLGTASATIAVSLENLVFHNYYPHEETPERAQVIAVAAGQETPGIDFVIALPPSGDLRGAAPGQMPGTSGSGVIQGRVVRADGLPIRRARVQLISGERLFTPYFVQTDDDGRYEFPGLRQGSYLIAAGTLAGTQVPFSASGAPGRPDLLTLAAGAVMDHIDITIPSPGVIAGRILDEYGDPMANANVRIEAVGTITGRRRLVPVPGVVSRLTNDLGRYRISGLPPGRYVVGAVVGEDVPGGKTADWPGYARTYFPGTPSPAEAQTLDVASGQQPLTVDFPLVRGHIARIAGTASSSNGAPLQGVMSLTQSSRSGAIGTPPVSVRTADDGSFVFERIAPGEYVLQAATSRSTVSTEGEFASQFVAVDGTDITGLAVHLSAGSTIEGRLTFDGADPPDDPDFHLSPVPVDPDATSLVDNAPARADIHDDWTFEISGINGARRLRLTQAPEGWALKAVRVGGIDVTDAVLTFGTAEQSLRDVEVVITRRAAALTARVTDATGAPAFARVLVVFPVDRAQWYPQSRYIAIAPSPRDGTVTLRGLPPGDYYVTALDPAGRGGAGAAIGEEFLGSLVADATRITLTEGENRSISVGVSPR